MKMALMLLAALSLAPATAAAQSESGRQDDDRFSFRLGVQAFSAFSTSVRIDDLGLQLGTEIELENVTDLERHVAVGRLDLGLAFGRRHGFALSYYDIRRTGRKNLEIEVDWEGETYPTGIEVASRFEQRTVRASYDLSVLARPKAHVAVGIGVHTMNLLLVLDAVGDPLESEATTILPLPAVALSGAYRFTDKWRFAGRIDWLQISGLDGAFTGGVFTNATASLEHQTFERFGFGFGVDLFDFAVVAEDTDLAGEVRLGFDAFMLFMRGRLGRR